MNKLLFEQKISIIKQMSTEKDLKTIINKFESNQVEMIVLKGNALILKKLINSRLRQTKDIDILIDKENLPKAYIKLRELGYRYINPLAKDAANVLYSHHMPTMINENGTLVELHWRITKESIFKKCPLIDLIKEEKEPIADNKFCFLPSRESLLIHIAYHGLIANHMKLDPSFFSDIKSIIKDTDTSNKKILSILDEMNIKKEMISVYELIRNTSELGFFSKESKTKLYDALSRLNSREEKGYSFSKFIRNKESFDLIIKRIKEKYKFTQYKYQRKNGFLLWLLFLKELINSIKKFKL